MTASMKRRCQTDVSRASESEGGEAEEAREEYELFDVISMRVSYSILYTHVEKSYLPSPNIAATCCSHQLLFTSSLGISRLGNAFRFITKYGPVNSWGEGGCVVYILFQITFNLLVQQNKKEQARPITWQEV